MPIAYVGLGANLGDREETIRRALARLAEMPGIRVDAVSRLRETAPVGGPPGQPPYLNGAARLETSLEPRPLLEALLAVEASLGRVRSARNAPRTIDLDLLTFDDRRIDEPHLVVPHPRMLERPFVMEPLADLGFAPPPRLLRSIPEMRELRRALTRAGKRVGFVPTMGALHEGHVSLAREARRTCDAVIVSIFVNPTQFGPGEDFSRYPRDLEGDLRLLAPAGVDAVFTTTPGEMYPEGFRTFLSQDDLGAKLEGAARPGHFRGVLTVVCKLFHIVLPDAAFFGQKDLQQTVVLRRMVADLDMDLALVVCPTVREPDGLAMSSRNRYLTPAQRESARCLSRGLFAAEAAFHAGERGAQALRALVEREIAAAAETRPGYVEVVSLASLDPVETATEGDAIVVAAHVGTTRLLDNVILGARTSSGGSSRTAS